MAGIAQMPQFFIQLFEGGRSGSVSGLTIFAMVALVVGMILFISFMERATRRLLDPVSGSALLRMV
jgi:preprotein translocase subunit SecY